MTNELIHKQEIVCRCKVYLWWCLVK